MESNEPVFSDAEYIRAFRAVASQITVRHRAILAAFYNAPNHTATSGELADALGYQSRQPLNKSLSHLAELLCRELGVHSADPVVILATSHQPPGKQPQHAMRAGVIKALETLGWFAP